MRPREGWRRTTDSSHREPIAPNILDRNFTAEAPDRVWVADTTYLPVLGGFLFLVVILDLFSRKVVGWSIGDRLDAELSGDALQSAIGRRQPRPGLIFHSDRGSEFAAQSFRHLLAQIGAVQSMGRKGNCGRGSESAHVGLLGLFAFVESYYNAHRLHSHDTATGGPNETESDWRSQLLAA